MSAREELRHLLDLLDEEGATEALAYLRSVFDGDAPSRVTAAVRLQARMKPQVVSGQAFFGQQRTSLSSLAARQGVRPVVKFDDLLGDFWPDNETADEFITALREWRRDGGHG
jgi:hypothetical protein